MYGGNFDGAGVLARRVLGFSAVLHRSRCIRAISSRRNGICTCRRYFLSFSDVGLFSNSASAANICFLQYIQRLALAPLLKDKEPREVLIESQFALQTSPYQTVLLCTRCAKYLHFNLSTSPYNFPSLHSQTLRVPIVRISTSSPRNATRTPRPPRSPTLSPVRTHTTSRRLPRTRRRSTCLTRRGTRRFTRTRRRRTTTSSTHTPTQYKSNNRIRRHGPTHHTPTQTTRPTHNP